MRHHRAQRLVVTASHAEPGPHPGSRPPASVLTSRNRLSTDATAASAAAASAAAVHGNRASGGIGALYMRKGNWLRVAFRQTLPHLLMLPRGCFWRVGR